MTKESVGEFLKRERELRQITLQEVAEGTKISIRRLRSIEADQFEDLPAEVFVRGFVKSYADYIGVDPADAILRLEENMPREELEMNNIKGFSPTHIDIKRYGSPVLLIAAVVAGLLILAGIWFFFFQNHQISVPGLTDKSPPASTAQVENFSTGIHDPKTGTGPQILLEEEAGSPADDSDNTLKTSEHTRERIPKKTFR